MKFLFVCNNPFVLGNSMLLLTLCRFIGIRSCARGRQWGQRAFRWRSPPFNLIFFFIVLLLILDLLLLRLIARRSIVELVAYIQYTHTQTNMCRVHAGLPISRPAKKNGSFIKRGVKKITIWKGTLVSLNVCEKTSALLLFGETTDWLCPVCVHTAER